MNDELFNLWSFGRYALRLTDAEFGALSPRELQALIDRHDEERFREDWRAALICSVLANISRDSSKRPEPFKISDFMPGKPSEPVEQEWETQKAIFGAFSEAAKQGKVNG